MGKIRPRTEREALENYMPHANTHECWPWQGPQNGTGYGVLQLHRVRWVAHRWVYEQLVGSIPEGKVLDHLCRNRICVNPRHLEPVTFQENCRRGVQGFQLTGACRQGHPIRTAEDVYVRPNGKRECMACVRERNVRYSEKRRLEGGR